VTAAATHCVPGKLFSSAGPNGRERSGSHTSKRFPTTRVSDLDSEFHNLIIHIEMWRE
jgi:hypothetical protein